MSDYQNQLRQGLARRGMVVPHQALQARYSARQPMLAQMRALQAPMRQMGPGLPGAQPQIIDPRAVLGHVGRRLFGI